MAVVAIFDVSGATAAKYEESLRRLEEIGQRIPDGQLYHICYGDEDNLQVIDVFESRAKLEAFGAKLTPMLKEIGIEATARVFEVHNILVA